MQSPKGSEKKIAARTGGSGGYVSDFGRYIVFPYFHHNTMYIIEYNYVNDNYKLC